jgi:GTPase SAR1 family protein
VYSLAILDKQNNHIVIRLVYDGPPLAGKTTSLKALAGSLSQDVYTPEEVDGRTIFFDWMEYTGGLFEGYQIRCQIISIPGQIVLAPRRQRLLESADAVVFVGDATRQGIDESLSYLKGLVRLLKTSQGPPVGIIFQANKRDQIDAVEIAEIKQRLNKDIKDIGIIESIATQGIGIRQTFVFGVRLSLDRVREYIRTHSLPEGKPDIDNGQELLQSMQAAERSALLIEMGNHQTTVTLSNGLPVAGAALHNVLACEDEINNQQGSPDQIEPETVLIQSANTLSHNKEESANVIVPNLPSSEIQAGLIWPPVEGRIILHEAIMEGSVAEPLSNGDWTVTLQNQWRLYSYQTAIYSDLNQARQALLQWAHLHLAATPILSPRRCLAVAESGDKQWRLWQVIKTEPSLSESLRDLLIQNDIQSLADGIWGTIYLFLIGIEKLKETPDFITYKLDTLSCLDWDVVYNDLMPLQDIQNHSEVPASFELIETMKADIKAILTDTLTLQQGDMIEILRHLRKRVENSSQSQKTFEIICELFESLVNT